MNLIDMKRSKEKVEEATKASPSLSEESYPYGLRLNLDNDEIKKFSGLKDIEVGAKVTIEAVGKVLSVSINDSEEGGKRRSVSIQMQQIAIDDQGSGKAAFKEATEK